MADTDQRRSIWTGHLVRLRAFSASDWKPYADWNQDDQQARALWYIPFPRSEEWVRHWAEREATREPDADTFRFTIEDQAGSTVGDLTVHQCDRRSGTFSYGVSIASVHRRKGYAREAILLALRYYFGELRYNKVTVFVYSFNAPSIGLHESLRFRKEGELRQMAVTGGCYCEQHVYGLTAREFAELYGFDFPAQAPR